MVQDGGEYSVPCPCNLTPGNSPGTQCQLDWVGPWAGLDRYGEDKILPHWGSKPGLYST